MEGSSSDKSVHRVSFFKLFTYADSTDYGLMALGSLGACIHGACGPVWFIFFGQIINNLGLAYLDPPAAAHRIARFSLLFVYLSVIMLFSSWAEVACWMYTGERQTTRIRLAYLKAVLNHDVSFFDTDATSGDVVTAITQNVIEIQEAISEKVGNFLHYISRFIAGFVVGFATVWQLSLVTLSIMPLIVIAGGFHAFVVTILSKRIRMSYVKAGGILEETIANLRTVYAFVGEEKSLASYRAALKETCKLGKRGDFAKGLGLGTLYCLLYLSWSLLLWYTSILVHKGTVNGGEGFSTMNNVIISSMALAQAAPDLAAFGKARTSAYAVFKRIQQAKVCKKNKHGKKCLELKSVLGNLEFRGVYFSYPSRPDVPIFENLNFKIPAGKVVAFVGGSGSGKSTLVSLVERFYEPVSGKVFLDEHDVSSMDLRWYRGCIGLVNQEPALFATSIKENILYGKEDATMEDIIHAAKLSAAHPFINNLPKGYETQVGEKGVQISGGQKQRIAIARAIVKNPPILLLDEATSALDAESEKNVHDAIDILLTGRTTVIVAHRLSTIRSADIIAVLQNGKIVESGDHESLISKNGAYATLVKLQSPSSTMPLESASLNQTKSNHRHQPGSRPTRTFSFGAGIASEKGSTMRFGSEIKPRYVPRNKVSFGRLLSMASPDWLCGCFGALGCVAAGAMTPLFAVGMTQGIVSIYNKDYEQMKEEIRKICLLFVGASVATFCAHIVAHFSFGTMAERLVFRVREMMFAAILKNEVAWFDEDSHNSGAIAARIGTDALLVRSLVIDRIAILITNLSTIIISFVIAFLEQWRLALVILATFPLVVVSQMSEKLFIQGYGINLTEAYLKANMLASESVANIRTVVAFNAEDKVVSLFSKELKIPGKQSFRRGQVTGMIYGIAQFMLYSSYGLALWYASTLIKHAEVSFGSVMKTFIVLILSALIVAETLATCPDMIKGADVVASTFEIIDRESEIPPGDSGGEEVDHVDGVIELKHVYFNYPSRPDIIIFEDLNLKVSEGSSVALIGTSGSGKSSITALILRFYDPIAGTVMVDGKDIKKLNLRSIRKHIGLVQQEPTLFSTTIYDNILYGKENACEAEVVEAAKLANAHGFINSLPDGYKTEVGERGIQLSGGQKQRVAIARAVLKNPAILLLDEATSALDAESERAVQDALNRLMKNRTTIVIAHKLFTVRNADVIYVLQDGKIVEQGNHSELTSRDGSTYSKLITLQQ